MSMLQSAPQGGTGHGPDPMEGKGMWQDPTGEGNMARPQPGHVGRKGGMAQPQSRCGGNDLPALGMGLGDLA